MTMLALALALATPPVMGGGGGFAADGILGSALNGLAFSAADDSMTIRDTTTPANAYTGKPAPKLGNVRASAAMLYNAAGLLEWGPENLALRSQEIENATWVNGTSVGVTASANAIAAPDGTLTADKIQELATSAAHNIQCVPSIPVVSGVIHTLSAYVRAAEKTWCVLADGSVPNAAAWFNIPLAGPGSVGTRQVNNLAATIQALPNGWYRISITYLTVGVIAGARIYVAIADNATTYLGVVGEGIYAWGIQLERASAPRTYLPTVGSAVYGFRRDNDPRLGAGVWGYLAEEARTNIILRSHEFNNASWIPTQVSITADAIVAPDGTTTFDILTEDASSALHSIFTGSLNGTGVGIAYTMSVFAKRNGRDLQITYNSVGFGSAQYANFDLATGVLGTVVGGTANILAVAPGIYRCSFTATATASDPGGAGGSFCLISSLSATRAPSYLGNGSSGVYLWGAQHEIGAFASSYIPTTTAAVTRAADVPTLAGTLFPLNQAEGTLYMKAVSQAATPSGTTNYGITLDDNTTSELITLARTVGNILVFSLVDGGVNQITINSAGPAATLAPFKDAAGYKLNDSAVAHNGEITQQDNVCTMPTTTKIILGNRSDGVRALNGWLLEGLYLNVRETDSQLQQRASGFASDAALLMGAELDGLTFSASDSSMLIKDTVTPANNYTGALSAKLGSIAASARMRYNNAGSLVWGPENLYSFSQDFENGYWTKSGGSSLVANSIMAPDGTMTADALTVVAQFNGITRTGSVIVLGERYTQSVWVKVASGTRQLHMADSGGNLYTPFIATTVWTRYVMTFTSLITGNIFVLQDRNSSGFVEIHIWGAQLERAAAASTYKPTTSSPYYGLRLDYDPRLVGGPGYLVEEQRANYALHSSSMQANVLLTVSGGAGNFTNGETVTATGLSGVYNARASSATVFAITTPNLAGGISGTLTGGTSGATRTITSAADVWEQGKADTASYPTILPDQAVAPDGATNATEVFFSAINTANDVSVIRQLVSSSGVISGSIWLKAKAAGDIGKKINIYLNDGAVKDRVECTLTALWQRVSTLGASASVNPRFTIGTIGSTYGGANQASVTCHVWGAQIELGANASSYVPTTSAIVTRAADVPMQLTSTFHLNPLEGTLVIRGASQNASTLIGYLLALDNGTLSDLMTLNRDGSARANFTVLAGGANYAGLQSAAAVNQNLFNAAAFYKQDDFGAVFNAEAIIPDVSGLVPSMTALVYGSRRADANRVLNGWLRHGRYFPRRVSNSELVAMAAQQ